MCNLCIITASTLDPNKIAKELEANGVLKPALYGKPEDGLIRFLARSIDLEKLESKFGAPAKDGANYVFKYGKGSLSANPKQKLITITTVKVHTNKAPETVVPEVKKVTKRGDPTDAPAEYYFTPELSEEYEECIRSSGNRLRFISHMWLHFNATFFNKRLTRPTLQMIPNTTSAKGLGARGLWYPKSRRLQLHPRLFNATPIIFCEVLLHEMCHQAVTDLEGGEREEEGHGPKWRAWMTRIGQVPSRYDMNDNTAYMDDDERAEIEKEISEGYVAIPQSVLVLCKKEPVPATVKIAGKYYNGAVLCPSNNSGSLFDFMPDPPNVDEDGLPKGWKVVSIDNIFAYTGKDESKFDSKEWRIIRSHVFRTRAARPLRASVIEENQMNDKETLQAFVQAFLQLNASPKDEQVHALAEALGCDHKALEELIYKMLAKVVKASNPAGVADGTIPEDNTNIEDLLINDGTTSDSDVGNQEELKNDGVDVTSEGVGLSLMVEDLLTDDGVV